VGHLPVKKNGKKWDIQCAELNRQEIGGASPLPGKVLRATGIPSHGPLIARLEVKR
jgi:hypothetical protein